MRVPEAQIEENCKLSPSAEQIIKMFICSEMTAEENKI